MPSPNQRAVFVYCPIIIEPIWLRRSVSPRSGVQEPAAAGEPGGGGWIYAEGDVRASPSPWFNFQGSVSFFSLWAILKLAHGCVCVCVLVCLSLYPFGRGFTVTQKGIPKTNHVGGSSSSTHTNALSLPWLLEFSFFQGKFTGLMSFPLKSN